MNGTPIVTYIPTPLRDKKKKEQQGSNAAATRRAAQIPAQPRLAEAGTGAA